MSTAGGLPPIPQELKKLRGYFTLARQIAKAGNDKARICSWLLRRHGVQVGTKMPGVKTPNGRAFIVAALDVLEAENAALPPHTGEEELEILQVYAFKTFKMAEAPDLEGRANKATAMIYLNASHLFECLIRTAGEDSQHIPVEQFQVLRKASKFRSFEIVKALKEGRRPDPPAGAQNSSPEAAATSGSADSGAEPVFGSAGAPAPYLAPTPAAAPASSFSSGPGNGYGAGSAPVFTPAPAADPVFTPAPAPAPAPVSSAAGDYVPTFGSNRQQPPPRAPAPAPAPAPTGTGQPNYDTDDLAYFESLIPAAPSTDPLEKPTPGMPPPRPNFGHDEPPKFSAAPAPAPAPGPAAAPRASQQSGVPNISNQNPQLAGVFAAVNKAKASDAARNYGDALEEYKLALQQVLSANKTLPGLTAQDKAGLMNEARHGMTRAEQIKKELTTLPPPLPSKTLDPLFTIRMSDGTAVQLVSQALQQDLRGNLGNALEVYKKALNAMMMSMRAAKGDPRASQILMAQVKTYMTRAEQLKDWLKVRGRNAD